LFVKRKERGFRMLRDVSWEEIKEAEAHGEEEMEFELTDIMESASVYGGKFDRLVENNIKYVLEREGLLPRRYEVVIPSTALYWECDGGTCHYNASFEVFDESGRNIVAYGVAYGSMMLYDEEEAELMDMTVTMKTGDVKKLKSLAERLKASIASIFG